MNILYLSLNPDLQGPFSKIDPLLMAALQSLGCQVIKSTWGRHSEHESLFKKIYCRLMDIKSALMVLVKIQPDILYIGTKLDEYALVRDITLLLASFWSPVKKVLMIHGSQSGNLV